MIHRRASNQCLQGLNIGSKGSVKEMKHTPNFQKAHQAQEHRKLSKPSARAKCLRYVNKNGDKPKHPGDHCLDVPHKGFTAISTLHTRTWLNQHNQINDNKIKCPVIRGNCPIIWDHSNEKKTCPIYHYRSTNLLGGSEITLFRSKVRRLSKDPRVWIPNSAPMEAELSHKGRENCS